MKIRKLLHLFITKSRFKTKRLRLRYQQIFTEVYSFMNSLTSCKRDVMVQEENWVDGCANLSHAGHQGLSCP